MSTEDTPQTSDSENTRQRRRSPLAVASVAAAVLLAGGGGAYWASTAGGGGSGSADEGAPAPLALDGYHKGAAAGGGSDADGPADIAPGEPNPYGRYKAVEKLPTGPKDAPVYTTHTEVTKDEAARLAKVLDVPGSPREENGTWKVGGAPDAMGPVLQVNRKGPGVWSFSRYGAPRGSVCSTPPSGATGKDSGVSSDGRTCPSYRGGSGPGDAGGGARSDGAKGSDGNSGSKGDTSKSGQKAVSEAKAKDISRPVLETLGLQDAKLDAEETHGALRVVTADPVLDDTATYGWGTGLEIAADGQLVGGHGMLASPKKGDSYPVLTASEALKLLNAGGQGTDRSGTGGCASAVPEEKKADPAKGSDAAKGSDSTSSGQIAPCEPDPGPASRQTAVDGARFGLATHLVNGRQALVPSWIFSVKGDGATGDQGTYTLSYPAVEPEFIKGDSSPGGHDPSSDPDSAKARDVTSYSVSGRTLTLHFYGGVCNTYSVSAEQSSSQVKVALTGKAKDPGKKCVMIAKRIDKKVTLDKPLDDRKVVDASNGKALPVK